MSELICPQCGKVCKSPIGLSAHVRACKGKQEEEQEQDESLEESQKKAENNDEVIILIAKKPISATALKYLRQDLRSIELKTGLKIEIVSG